MFSANEVLIQVRCQRATQRSPSLSVLGVSVRKRVVKIFRDECLSPSDFIRISDIFSRLLRRTYDEEIIREVVIEIFQQLWFSRTRIHQDDQ
jgi:hypothetical protein